jgi:hypothetical protein
MAEPTLNVTDLVAEFGAYYQNNGQNVSRLNELTYATTNTASYFGLQLTNDTIFDSSLSDIGEVQQAYQDSFTPKGDVNFAPVRIELFHQKIDWAKNPQSLSGTWAGFLTGDGAQDVASWPFTRWLIETKLIPRYKGDYEKKSSFNGVYVAPVEGTAGSAKHAMDGIGIIINKWIDSGRTTPITTGALETDPEDFVTQVEEFVKDIDDDYIMDLDIIFMNMTKFKLYKEGMRAKYNMNYSQAVLDTVVDNEHLKIVGLQSMGASEKLWAAPPEIRKRFQKRSQNINTFQVESKERKLSVYTDWYEVLNFTVPEKIFTNNQQLTVPVS